MAKPAKRLSVYERKQILVEVLSALISVRSVSIESRIDGKKIGGVVKIINLRLGSGHEPWILVDTNEGLQMAVSLDGLKIEIVEVE